VSRACRGIPLRMPAFIQDNPSSPQVKKREDERLEVERLWIQLLVPKHSQLTGYFPVDKTHELQHHVSGIRLSDSPLAPLVDQTTKVRKQAGIE